ncbi:MAG: hypothetical protein ACYDEN_11325, partial [Acidimicrobiales bacterium]
MPRRRRPPLTARELGAFAAGARLARTYPQAGRHSGGERRWVLEHLAAEDAEVMASMPDATWWSRFYEGWESVTA